MMNVRSHATVEEFWSQAGPLLSADPVRFTVEVAIVGRLSRGAGFGDEPPTLVTVHDDSTDNRLIGVALCTPPWPITVTALPTEAAATVVDHLLDRDIRPVGVRGTRPEAEAFATAWTERTGHRSVIKLDQRLYHLEELSAPTDVPGVAAPATDDDIELAIRWRAAFIGEALHRPVDLEASRGEIQRSWAAGNVTVLWWVDGEPVSLAGIGRPYEGMSRIGPVYTPPEHRGRGYGSAVTAAASQRARDLGATHVVLFTDLANPTSNSIYQRIGYRPVADALEAAFEPGGLP